MEKKIINLEILDNVDDSGVSAISLVDVPAIEKDWMAFKQEKFVEPSKGEHEDEFIPRCIAYNVGEGKDPDQAAAICYSVWESHRAEFEVNDVMAPYPSDPYYFEKVSFDYDDTLSTGRGLDLATTYKEAGNELYIISARNTISKGMRTRAEQLGISTDKIFATGSNAAKIAKIKELGINKHVDNNPDVVKDLDKVGEKFSYDTSALPAYTNQIGDKKKKKFADTPDSVGLDIPLFLRLLEIAREQITSDDQLHSLVEKAALLSQEGKILTMDDVSTLTSDLPVKMQDVTDPLNFPDGIDAPEELGYPSMVTLPRDHTIIIKANDDEPAHGLLVKLLENGGYDVKYWYNNTKNVVPAEVEVDGYRVADEAMSVHLGYHSHLPMGQAFTKQSKYVFASEDQQIVVGPAMIPDMEIVRKHEEGPDKGKPYWVKFSKDVIKRIAEKFMMELRNHDTNILHNAQDPAHSFVMETWIVENEEDKANSFYNFDVPVGTWMVKMRVQDPETWKMIKAGKLNGFSIEGNFMSEEDYEAYQKDNELYDRVIKILKSI